MRDNWQVVAALVFAFAVYAGEAIGQNGRAL